MHVYLLDEADETDRDAFLRWAGTTLLGDLAGAAPGETVLILVARDPVVVFEGSAASLDRGTVDALLAVGEPGRPPGLPAQTVARDALQRHGDGPAKVLVISALRWQPRHSWARHLLLVLLDGGALIRFISATDGSVEYLPLSTGPLDDDLGPTRGSQPTTSVPGVKSPFREIAFTAVHGRHLRPGVRQQLVFCVHLAELAAATATRLLRDFHQVDGPHQIATAGAALRLAAGTRLTVVPSVPGVEFNPARVEVSLREDFHDLLFDVTATAPVPSGSWSGVITVLAGAMVVGSVPFTAFDAGLLANGETTIAAAGTPQAVFASYARADEHIVRACVEPCRALGIRVFLDVDDIRSGQPWRRRIAEAIDEADAFQLFWSRSASVSPHVREEWVHALNAAAKAEPFIRPVVWEEPSPPPPDELAELHFTRLDLATLFGAAAARLRP